ncbi:gliding motility-associated-like protein [Saonia flava]|uniref:Gliding motility-associated-like protein n=1 Tax=Saonia flava TaxID=523696 RepID=A0A846QTF1_9FLAO|nr:T9SS type B sorting domain-containing protein [Saonia flava]NJB72246.1 gliding motility-associated-like protein [Saonia flava]
MLPKKTRHLLYAILLIFLSIVCSTAIANNKGYNLFAEITDVMDVAVPVNSTPELNTNSEGSTSPAETINTLVLPSMPMFTTIILGANEEVTCPNDGSTLAKFFLCGTSDIRTISLSQSGGSYQWQKLDGGSCATSVVADCPTTNSSCTWNTVGTNSTYDLNSGGEFRVRVDSGEYFYFKSSLNPLDPQVVKEDIVCGNPGRVEITNVPAGYEYSLNNSAGPYQDTPYFDVTTPGDYMVWVRLKNVSATACLFPSNTVTITSSDIRAEVVANDILCSGELGSIDVQVFDVPGFYTYRLIKNGVTVDTFGPNGSDAYTFDNVSSGTYSIRVETNDCSELITQDINGNPIVIGGGISPLNISATATDSFGCGATSVDVTVNTSGGTAPYRFSLDGGTSFSSTYTSSTTFTVTSAGNYSILVEDANGCTHTAAVDVENIPEPTYTITPNDGNCGGANDGSITMNVTNTNGYNLTYSINGGATFQVSNVFSNLAPNTYNVIIRYQQGAFSCDINDTATIGTLSTISGTANVDVSPTCANETGGQISITGVSGGAGGYEYSIGAGFSGTSVFTNLGVGTYTPRVRDANGCIQTLAPITFAPFDKPTDLDFTISNIDCLTGTVSVTLAVTDGTGPYTYEIIAPGPSAVNNGASNIFTSLSLGTYTFRVTDSVGCYYDENFAITDISSISSQAQATRGVTCVGDSDGEGRFLVDGFNGTYSYSIDGAPAITGQTAGLIPLTGLAAGSYVISVTDEDTNCTDTATLVIEEPAVAFAIDSLSVVPMDCQNGNVGGVTINTSGGWGGNRYTLTLPDASTLGPSNSNTFSSLSQGGTYQITVNDANGCTLTDSFTLTPLSSPTISIDASTDYCFDNVDASSITVNAAGGAGSFEYRINNGLWQPANSFNGLTPGNYNVEVRDANNCRDNVVITIAPEITTNASIIQELDCGGPDAQIQINISNGYTSAGSYDYYEVSINGAPYTTTTTNIVGNSFVYSIPNDGSILTDTTFQFEVYDFRGCLTETNVVTISPPETIAGTATGQDTVCADPTSGVVTVTADTTQGIPPYEFSNDGGATYSTQNVFSGYAPGTYTDFMVRDSRGCESPLLSATIGTSTAVDATVVPVDAICTGTGVLGSIDVTGVANGTANYTYELYDISGTFVTSIGPTASTTEIFLNVAPGTYTVVTTDATGCEDRDVVTIDQNQLDLVPVNVVPPPDCTTPFFTYEVNIVGGTGPYLIGLVGNPLVSPNVDADTHDFSGEIAYGITYFVEVEDALGCTYIEQIDPIVSPSPIAIATTATTASCDPSGNGEISYTISGITPSPSDFTIQIQNTDTGAMVGGPISFTNEPMPYSDTLTGLQAGNYQILVNDDNTGCDASALVTITQDIPTVVIDSNIPATCNVGALVTVRANGGTAPYEFAYVPNGDPAPTVFSSITTYEIGMPYPDDYDFYVRDASGCVSFTTVTVTEGPGVPTPTVNVTNQCIAVNNYFVDVTSPLTTASGLPEDTFQYDIGGGFQSSPNFVVPNPGTYTIIVRDGNGCTNTVVAEVFDFFSITASATSEPTCNAGDGVITVNTSGGSGNFEYQLRDAGTLIDIGGPQSSNLFTGLFPGDYNIVVTDLDSNTLPLCTDDVDVLVSLVVSPVISSTPKNDVTCHDASDGSITIELQAGTDVDGPFYYTLYDGSGSTVLYGPQTSQLFSGLTDGTYQAEVVSERGCTYRSGDIIIINPPNFLINTTNTEFSCDPNNNKFNTALITVFTDSNGDGSGTPTGTPPYTYSMDDGTAAFDGTNFQTSNVFEVVDNGTDRAIIITARDQNGCEITDTFTINAPTDLTFSFNVNPITCDATGVGVNPGTIDIIVNEGAGNYEVEILPLGSEAPRSSGGTDRVTWDISTPGDYIFAVRDLGLGGCNYLTPIVNVPDYNTIEALIAENRPVTCFNGNDGEINIEINNYVGAYNYEVFSRDNAGVETTTGVTGTFDTTAPIATPEIITGLPAGNLVVRVEALDTPFCDAVSNVATVTSPDRELTVALQQTSEVTCAVPGLGEIKATGDGGWGAYEYQVIAPDGTTIIQDYPDTNDVFTDLSSGIHTINVRDALGCISTNTIELLPPTPIYADIQVVTPLQCNNDNNAVIEAYTISGGQGTGNYLFQLNRLADGSTSGLQTTPIFANLSAGDYTITIFDGWDCSYTTLPITVMDPEVVVAELVELQPPGCGDVGLMELTVTNPEVGLDYFYRRAGTTDPFVPFGSGVVSVQIPADITMDPGPFQYDVQNSNGCPFEKSNQISLDAAAPLVISLDLTNATINCAGEATGIIRSEAFGGIGNYIYTLLNSNTPPNPVAANTVRTAQSSGIFRNLGPGTYYVFAESGACTAISTPIVIDPKPPLVLEYVEAFPVSCNGEMDGQITIEASGGTGNIRYAISQNLSEFFEGDDAAFPNRKTFTDLGPQVYEIIVQDDLGCTITQTLEILEPMALVSGVASSTPETCLGDNDGTITLEVFGGTPPYYTSVDSAAAADFVQNDSLFLDNISGGETHVIFVRDSQGCETTVIVPVGIGVDLVAEPIVQYGCDGIFPNSTVTIEMMDDSLLPSLLFSLDVDNVLEASTNRTFGDLPPGDHSVYIYHENGCVAMVEFTIEAYDPLTLEATVTGPNEITATAMGGFGGYEYFFQGESTGENNVYTINMDDTVTITVIDQNGCTATIMMPFNFTGMLDIPNYFTPDGDNMNDMWYPRNREMFANVDVKIYDRYGRVVAILDQVAKWDGTYEGSELPSGDYWYVVNANDSDKHQYVGHFTLYR